MGLLSLIVTLIVVGFLLYLANQYIPMEASIKKILNIVVIVAVCIWLLSLLGVFPDLNTIRIGK